MRLCTAGGGRIGFPHGGIVVRCEMAESGLVTGALVEGVQGGGGGG